MCCAITVQSAYGANYLHTENCAEHENWVEQQQQKAMKKTKYEAQQTKSRHKFQFWSFCVTFPFVTITVSIFAEQYYFVTEGILHWTCEQRQR